MKTNNSDDLAQQLLGADVRLHARELDQRDADQRLVELAANELQSKRAQQSTISVVNASGDVKECRHLVVRVVGVLAENHGVAVAAHMDRQSFMSRRKMDISETESAHDPGLACIFASSNSSSTAARTQTQHIKQANNQHSVQSSDYR